jgi:hypothetical protein
MFAQLVTEPQAAEPAPSPEIQAGGIELSVTPAAESTMELHSADGPLSVQPQQEPSVHNPAADETLPGGISLEPRLEISTGIPSESEAEKTVFAAPPPLAESDEGKTVVFEAGAVPGMTSRAQAGDLAGLSRREPPEGIPAERIRPIYFVYSPEDPALCASLLLELDNVCMHSQTSPMFIKRAGVKAFEPGTNANFLVQTVSDSGAKGLICVGGIPQDKIYEVENAFSSSGVYFKHLDSANFSHSEVLDLLLEMILR